MPLSDEQGAKIMETLGRLDERTANIEKAVLGNGQPGLAQKVEDLEEHKNKVTGAVTVVGLVGGGLWGFLEWLFHFKAGH